MNSHFQSSDTTSTSIGAAAACKRVRGSKSCELIQQIPPRNRTTSAGIAHTTNSMRPAYSHSGSRRALRLPARNHHANRPVARITGTTTASMMTVALKRMVRSAPPIGPCGSSTPEELQAHSNKMLWDKTSAAQALIDSRILRFPQKALENAHERIQLIVMHPVSGIGKRDDARVPEMTYPPIFLGIRRPTFIAVAKQRGTADRAPQLVQLLQCDVDRRKYMHIVVELPTPRAVLVAAGGMLCEVLCLFSTQVLIFAAHPFQGIAQRRVAARAASAHRAAVADPVLPVLLQRSLLPFCEHFRRGA